jgi:mRNA interferase RelE/StbE
MAWTIEFDPAAAKELRKLGPDTSKRILRFLEERIAPLDDPRTVGEPLHGSRLGEFWKYRLGDYRIVANIEDQKVHILIVRVGNRREVYR